jgi:hypothetical protein
VIDELRLYSYKVDRLTGDPLPELVDKHNHLIDSLRYAVEPIQKRAGGGIADFYAQMAAGLNVETADPSKPPKQPQMQTSSAISACREFPASCRAKKGTCHRTKEQGL